MKTRTKRARGGEEHEPAAKAKVPRSASSSSPSVAAGSAAAAAGTVSSPVSTLHRDALHCIFAFLGKRGPESMRASQRGADDDRVFHGALEHVAAAGVCHSWRDALYSYSAPAGHAEVLLKDPALLAKIAASPLRRCVGRVMMREKMVRSSTSPSGFRELATALPSLRHLDCTVDLRDEPESKEPWALHLPPRLQTLAITLSPNVNDAQYWTRNSCSGADRLTAAMTSLINAGSQLVSLQVRIPGFFGSTRSRSAIYDRPPVDDGSFDPAVNKTKLSPRFAWAPLLRQLTNLRSFVFTDGRGSLDQHEWPNEAIDALRSLPNLTYLDCFEESLSNWRRLTAAPHSLKLRRLPAIKWLPSAAWGTILADCVRRLPTLTKFDAEQMPTIERDPALLLHLPALRDLRWVAKKDGSSPPEMELRTCAQLTSLHLADSQLTDAQLCEILPCMPHLESISLERMPQLHSLQFLASSPHLATRLTELRLFDVHLLRDEFLSSSCPVRSLRSLKSLLLGSCVPPSDLYRVEKLVEKKSRQQHWPHMRTAEVTPYHEEEEEEEEEEEGEEEEEEEGEEEEEEEDEDEEDEEDEDEDEDEDEEEDEPPVVRSYRTRSRA